MDLYCEFGLPALARQGKSRMNSALQPVLASSDALHEEATMAFAVFFDVLAVVFAGTDKLLVFFGISRNEKTWTICPAILELVLGQACNDSPHNFRVRVQSVASLLRVFLGPLEKPSFCGLEGLFVNRLCHFLLLLRKHYLFLSIGGTMRHGVLD